MNPAGIHYSGIFEKTTLGSRFRNFVMTIANRRNRPAKGPPRE
jgi:hypothetical protein